MILLTGASGFLGSAIRKYLFKEELISLGRNSGDIISDLSIEVPKLPNVNIVIHAAGKAHSVPKSRQEEDEFYDANVKGTSNLLAGLERCNSMPKSFIFISSVSVYGCEKGTLINEEHPLNATDAYGLSKIRAEELVQEWCVKNSVICSLLRLPLLVDQNPPGNLGAMIKAIKCRYYFNIAGGKARKSMVLAEDVANIIPIVARIGGVYNLSDGNHPSFLELSNQFSTLLGKGQVLNIPSLLAKGLASIGNVVPKFPLNSRNLKKMTSDLTFDDSRARVALNWSPKRVIENIKL